MITSLVSACTALAVALIFVVAWALLLSKRNRNLQSKVDECDQVIKDLKAEQNESAVAAATHATRYELLRADCRQYLLELMMNRAVLEAFHRLVPGLRIRLTLLYAAYMEKKDEAERQQVIGHVYVELAHLVSGPAARALKSK